MVPPSSARLISYGSRALRARPFWHRVFLLTGEIEAMVPAGGNVAPQVPYHPDPASTDRRIIGERRRFSPAAPGHHHCGPYGFVHPGPGGMLARPGERERR
ncbi:hypothetical protein GCM10029978_075100 [Actinoallomurus acanthiterrae]